MRTDNNNLPNSGGAWRRLAVEWLEPGEAQMMVVLSPGRSLASEPRSRLPAVFMARRPVCASRVRGWGRFSRAFTILELMLVIGIIGLMAALALPHLSGFTKGNTMTAATRQLLDDVALARQRAMVNRSEVCMVFLPPNFWTNDQLGGSQNSFSNNQITTSSRHQYAAYALVSLRTVGDQPGLSNVHYLTDWRFLPQGIFIYPVPIDQLGRRPIEFIPTNTTSQPATIPTVVVTPFTNNILFPFPSTFVPIHFNLRICPILDLARTASLSPAAINIIAVDQRQYFFPVEPEWAARNGRPMAANATAPVETPPGKSTTIPNLIHIDWLTARAKIEQNQF